MKRACLLVAALLSSVLASAETVAISKFSGINNNESSVIIDTAESQDQLNVDSTPGGKSIRKRQGFGVYKSLATGQAPRGGAHFYDSNGSDVQVWGSSTSLYGIISDAAPTQLISSATLNSTWDCADTQGNAYCVNSNRDALIKTNGATKTWYTTPLGTMIEVTPDRLAVAGVSGTPNTIYVSGVNDFTNFTVGLNSPDPFSEVIAASGGKISHIRWACQKLLWWKQQSFGYFDFEDQFSATVKVISDNVGTLDNTSTVDPGGRVWFRGQDGHTWMYDCSGLQKMSIPITPNVQTSGARVSNSWTQSSQTEFQTGGSSPTANISTTISPGDVVQSSFSVSEYSSTQWNSGVTGNTVVGASSITLAFNNSGTITDPSFEGTLSTNFTGSGMGFVNSYQPFTCGVTNPQAGSQLLSYGSGSSAVVGPLVQFIDYLSGAALASTNLSCGGTCSTSWTQTSLSSSGLLGKRAYVKFCPTNNINKQTCVVGSATSKVAYVIGGDLSFYYNCSGDSSQNYVGYDNVSGGSSTITTGWFHSQVFDTALSSPTYQATTFNYTANTSTPTFGFFSGPTATGPWTLILSTSGTNAWGQRYALYSTTISLTSTDYDQAYISSVTLIARSTGTYYSAVKNAPSLTAWSTFTTNKQDNGGTHTFFIRSSTNSFTTLSSTPAWVAQTPGAQVSASTGTFFQVIDSFTVVAATVTPTLNDFTVNWFEGTATDQAYMLYFDNSIWQSVAFGSGQTTNNYIFKYDLINEGWTLYNFGAGGMLIQNNALYFGDTSSGNVFKFGTGTSDNGAAIRAFWRSKSFTSSDPWNQATLKQIDSYWTRNQSQTSSITYTMDGSTSTTAYTVPLSSTTKSIISHMKLIPSGKIGQLFDVQFGDTSDSSRFELLGARITFDTLPYRPSSQ